MILDSLTVSKKASSPPPHITDEAAAVQAVADQELVEKNKRFPGFWAETTPTPHGLG
jgi:hypothetical protein